MNLGRLTTTGETISLSDAERGRHLYAIGKSGTGKTSFLESQMRQDLANGRGFCFLDPHGDSSAHLADCVPAHRIKDVIYLDPSDLAFSPSLNFLENVALDDRSLIAAQIVACLKGPFAASWGPRMEYILTNAIRLLLDNQGIRNSPCETLLGLPRLLVDVQYRDRLMYRCADPWVIRYWDQEFSRYEKRFLQDAISPIQNKIGQVLMPPAIRHLFGQAKSTINLKEIMDSGKCLIVNLSKGRLGEEPAHLLGALLISAFAQAASSRATMKESERADFTLYVDEFQNFATDAFATILSEARKWHLSLVLAHQFTSQTPESILDAVLGNVATTVAFRISRKDAVLMSSEMQDPHTGMPNTTAILELHDYNAWVKRTVEGVPQQAQSMETFPPEPANGSFDAVVARTHARYARPREVVEREIARALA